MNQIKIISLVNSNIMQDPFDTAGFIERVSRANNTVNFPEIAANPGSPAPRRA